MKARGNQEIVKMVAEQGQKWKERTTGKVKEELHWNKVVTEAGCKRETVLLANVADIKGSSRHSSNNIPRRDVLSFDARPQHAVLFPELR